MSDSIRIRHHREDFRIRPIAIIIDASQFNYLAPDGVPCVVGYNHGSALLSAPLSSVVWSELMAFVDERHDESHVTRDSRAPIGHPCDSRPTVEQLIEAHEKYGDRAYDGSWQQAELRAFQELKRLREEHSDATT